MTNCPNCGKQVDPLRAPAVGVRDGKVVPFCSKECAAAMESKPTKLVPTKIVRLPSSADKPTDAGATPASGVVAPAAAFDSGPVIEIIREPASEPIPRDSSAQLSGGTTRARPDSVQVAETGTLE